MKYIILLLLTTSIYAQKDFQTEDFDWDMTVGQLVDYEEDNGSYVDIDAIGGWRNITEIEATRLDGKNYRYWYSENGILYAYVLEYYIDGERIVESFNPPNN